MCDIRIEDAAHRKGHPEALAPVFRFTPRGTLWRCGNASCCRGNFAAGLDVDDVEAERVGAERAARVTTKDKIIFFISIAFACRSRVGTAKTLRV